jgi:hypothetical protein
MRPDKYPLPWCEEFDIPYYQVNLWLVFNVPGWAEKQAHIPMSEIIPWIDELIERKELKLESSNKH